MSLLSPTPGDTYKEFAQQHAPKLAENIAKLQTQVLVKGLTAHLEIACQMQARITTLEDLLRRARIDMMWFNATAGDAKVAELCDTIDKELRK